MVLGVRYVCQVRIFSALWPERTPGTDFFAAHLLATRLLQWYSLVVLWHQTLLVLLVITATNENRPMKFVQ